jgi:hypothetical protein
MAKKLTFVIALCILVMSQAWSQDSTTGKQILPKGFPRAGSNVPGERRIYLMSQSALRCQVNELEACVRMYQFSRRRWPQSENDLKECLRSIPFTTKSEGNEREIDIDSVLGHFQSIALSRLDSNWFEVKYEAKSFEFDSVFVEAFSGYCRMKTGLDSAISNTTTFRAFDRRNNRWVTKGPKKQK